MLGALALRPLTYQEIAADESAGIQAGLLVVVVGMIEASVLSSVHGETALETGSILYCVAAALIGWLVWSGILFAVGARLFVHCCGRSRSRMRRGSSTGSRPSPG